MKGIKRDYKETHKIIDYLEYKLCSDCSEWHPMTEEYFYKNKSSSDGFNPYCKKKTVERTLNNRNKNREENLAKMREYGREYMKRPERKENRREVMRKLVAEGKQKEWQRENKDKVKGYNKKHNNHTISKEEWLSCKEYFNNECAYCGLTFGEHKEKFNQDLHKEHVIHDGLNDLSNCIPSCKSCNSSKSDQTIHQWYRVDNGLCDSYSEVRLKKINKWLIDDYKLYIKENNQITKKS